MLNKIVTNMTYNNPSNINSEFNLNTFEGKIVHEFLHNEIVAGVAIPEKNSLVSVSNDYSLR